MMEEAKTNFLSAVNLAQRSFVNVKQKGKATGTDEVYITDLGNKVVALAKEVLRADGRGEEIGEVASEQLIRDEDIGKLAERAWLLMDGIRLTVERGGIEKEQSQVAGQFLSLDGAWGLKAICDEIAGRSTRKTADGLGPDEDFETKGISKGEQAIINHLLDIKDNFGIETKKR